jgi:hypothetical protein
MPALARKKAIEAKTANPIPNTSVVLLERLSLFIPPSSQELCESAALRCCGSVASGSALCLNVPLWSAGKTTRPSKDGDRLGEATGCLRSSAWNAHRLPVVEQHRSDHMVATQLR